MINNELDIRLKPAIESTSSTKVPLDGEIVLVKDTSNSANNNIRIGNGSTAISSLSNFLTMGGQGGGGTVTSVRVQATSPVQSSESSAQSTTLNTTISLADAYGDTKNPYGSKTANYVLAAPNGSAGVPSFRSLVAADIPNLSWNKLTSDVPTTLSGYGITDANISNGTITLGSNTITPLTNNPVSASSGTIGKIMISDGDNTTSASNYTIETSVPSGAVFTDTTYSDYSVSGTTATHGLVPAAQSSEISAGNYYLNANGNWSQVNGGGGTNSATLQVSDTTNKKINTAETTGSYIQFADGTNRFSVNDGTNQFYVGVTPSSSTIGNDTTEYPLVVENTTTGYRGIKYVPPILGYHDSSGYGYIKIKQNTYNNNYVLYNGDPDSPLKIYKNGFQVNNAIVRSDGIITPYGTNTYLKWTGSGYTWDTPSGSGTVTSIGVTGSDGLRTVISGTTGTTAITGSGNISILPSTASEQGALVTTVDMVPEEVYINDKNVIAIPISYSDGTSSSDVYQFEDGTYPSNPSSQEFFGHYVNVYDIVNSIIRNPSLVELLREAIIEKQ